MIEKRRGNASSFCLYGFVGFIGSRLGRSDRIGRLLIHRLLVYRLLIYRLLIYRLLIYRLTVGERLGCGLGEHAQILLAANEKEHRGKTQQNA